jgi:leucyl aminopeptidase
VINIIDRDISNTVNIANAERLLELHDAELSLDCADIARDLENEPANVMTPEKFCKESSRMLTPLGVKVRVLDVSAMQAEGLNLVLAVGLSSSSSPRFLVMEYCSSKKKSSRQYPKVTEVVTLKNYKKIPTETKRKRTICLVGKGVTFDAGGLRLKSAPNMIDMKQDKSGAAIVVSIMEYLARSSNSSSSSSSGGDYRVIGIAPLVENVINGRAMKPGDIVVAHNGSTVEILDPDAEGRLILADAISYACKYYDPDYIIDFATLTAFASNVCCDLSAVFHTTNEDLAAKIVSLGEATGERVWRLPPWPEYRVNTQSVVADVRNSNFECTRSGSFMAAMFISNFVPLELADKWVHFDISNNDVKTIHSGNCAFLGMQVLRYLLLHEHSIIKS